MTNYRKTRMHHRYAFEGPLLITVHPTDQQNFAIKAAPVISRLSKYAPNHVLGNFDNL